MQMVLKPIYLNIQLVHQASCRVGVLLICLPVFVREKVILEIYHLHLREVVREGKLGAVLHNRAASSDLLYPRSEKRMLEHEARPP